MYPGARKVVNSDDGQGCSDATILAGCIMPAASRRTDKSSRNSEPVDGNIAPPIRPSDMRINGVVVQDSSGTFANTVDHVAPHFCACLAWSVFFLFVIFCFCRLMDQVQVIDRNVNDRRGISVDTLFEMMAFPGN